MPGGYRSRNSEEGPLIFGVVSGFGFQLITVMMVMVYSNPDQDPGSMKQFAENMYLGVATISAIFMFSASRSAWTAQAGFYRLRVIGFIFFNLIATVHVLMVFAYQLSPVALGFAIVNAIRGVSFAVEKEKRLKHPMFLYSIVLHPIFWIWCFPGLASASPLLLAFPSTVAAFAGFAQIHYDWPNDPSAAIARKWGSIVLIGEAICYLPFLYQGGVVFIIASLIPVGIHLMPPRPTVAIGFLVASLCIHPAIWAWSFSEELFAEFADRDVFYSMTLLNVDMIAFTSTALAVVGAFYRHKYPYESIPSGQKNAISILCLITSFAEIIAIFAMPIMAGIHLIGFIMPAPSILLFALDGGGTLPPATEIKYSGQR
jgi:hypothetical protein